MFIERHGKGEVHVLVEKGKLFDHEFYLKHIIATRYFDFSLQRLTVFGLFFNWLHSATPIADSTIE